MLQCTLCGSQTSSFSVVHTQEYYKCTHCHSILLHSSYFLTAIEEKQRYDIHNNDVHDVGYQKSVFPIVSSVTENHTKAHKGLDFGSGSGPVVTMLLRNQGFNVQTFDPFYDPNPLALKQKYDYIICSEVMEHFYIPAKEFKLLHSLLKTNGMLYCKTNLYDETTNFDTWWYKNDPTHVFFYTEKTIHWIKKKYNFREASITKNVITFKI